MQEMAITPTEPAVGIKEAAKMLGIRPQTLQGWCRKGRFDGSYKLYGSKKLGWRIPLREIQALIAGQGHGTS